MNSHGKKMVAPVLITVLVVAYYIAFFTMLMNVTEGLVRLALGIVPLALAGTMIAVCIQRIKEIRSGEEDDLGKY